MSYVEYNSNNSGGRWWLSDDDWRALERAGWKVKWASLANVYDNDGDYVRDADGTPKLVPVEQSNTRFGMSSRDANGEWRYMGALAAYAYRVGLSLREAAAEFDRVTKCCSTDAGCPCCGNPHNFTEYGDDNKWIASGPEVSYEARW